MFFRQFLSQFAYDDLEVNLRFSSPLMMLRSNFVLSITDLFSCALRDRYRIVSSIGPNGTDLKGRYPSPARLYDTWSHIPKICPKHKYLLFLGISCMVIWLLTKSTVCSLWDAIMMPACCSATSGSKKSTHAW